MSADKFIEGLCAEASEAVRGLLRQAYDRGFREALASTGQPAAPPAAEPPAPAPDPVPSRVDWDARDATPERDLGDTSSAEPEEGDGEGEAAAGEVSVPRPILPNAMVGTLRRRIIRTFDLERFDIDVVICRTGDPDRRQLKSTARLGLYRREEQ